MLTEVFTYRSGITQIGDVLASALRELPSSARIGFDLGLREFRARYRGHFLGPAWAVITPLVYTIAFMVLMRAKNLQADTGSAPPAIFVFIGFSLFQVFLEAINLQLASIKRNRDLLCKIKLPPETLLFSGVTESFLSLVVRWGIILGACLLFRIPITAGWSLFLLFSFLVIFSGSVIGYLLLPIGALFQDVRKAIQSATLGILFITPVFYSPPSDASKLLYKLNVVNPLASLLCTAREALLGIPYSMINIGWFWAGLFLILVFVQILIMRIVAPIVVERMGN